MDRSNHINNGNTLLNNYWKTIILLLLFIGSVFSSCTPEPLEIEITAKKPELVISSQVLPGNILLVSVSRSFSALEKQTDSSKQSLLVNDAIVIVSNSGSFDTLELLSNGVYFSESILQNGNAYVNIKVYDKKEGIMAYANSQNIAMVPLLKTELDKSRLHSDSMIEIEYEFEDRPFEKNYYMVNYYIEIPSLENDNSSNRIDRLRKSLKAQRIETEFFTDKDFADGRSIRKRSLSGITQGDTIAISLSNISKGYFEFLQARKKSNHILNVLSGEAINYPTNVMNGHGYFSMHTPDFRILKI